MTSSDSSVSSFAFTNWRAGINQARGHEDDQIPFDVLLAFARKRRRLLECQLKGGAVLSLLHLFELEISEDDHLSVLNALLHNPLVVWTLEIGRQAGLQRSRTGYERQ
jgi:hypothetical protein